MSVARYILKAIFQLLVKILAICQLSLNPVQTPM